MGFSGKRVLAELRVYARGNVRSREGFFFTLVFPIILILLFGAIFAPHSGGIKVDVQNQDGGPVSVGFVKALNSTTAMQVVLVPPQRNFTNWLVSNSTADGIVIPAGFTQDFIQGKPVNVTVYGNPASTDSAVVSGITSEVVNAFNLNRSGGAPVIGVNSGLLPNFKSYQYIDFLVPGLIGFSALTSPMFALVNISSTYRRDKVFKLLSLTPLTKTEWLLSKIIWYIGTTSLSFFLMSVVGIYVYGAHIAFSWGIAMFLLVGPFFFVSLGMLVGTISNSPESAAVVGNLVTFPMMFLSGTFFPVQAMPMYLQNIAHALPLFYLINGLTDVMIYQNYGPAFFDFAILFALSLVVFALAVRFFRWRED